MKAIFCCSKLIRQAIPQSRKIDPWIFDGSLIGCSEKSVPLQLLNFIRWIIQGAKAGTTETRIKQLHKSCIILSQSILHACKTDKQVTLMPTSTESTLHCLFESPYAVGLSLYMYHNFRSQKAVSILCSMGNGVSYDRVITICNKITTAICENITEYGVYVPPGLLKNKRIRASMDNIDKKVDTPDGKRSFHGTALGVYQPTGQGETVVKPVQFSNTTQTREGLVDVPTTVIKLIPCTIDKNKPTLCKLQVGSVRWTLQTLEVSDTAWMLARFFNRARSCSKDDLPGSGAETPHTSKMPTLPKKASVDPAYGKQRVQNWSAYNSLVHSDSPSRVSAPPAVDKAFGLQIISAPAHEWATLVTALDQLTRLNTVVSAESNKKVVDMDLYKRVLKLEHLDPKYKNKWVLCPGAFHTVLCALRCLGRTIEGSGLDQAWQEADLYSSITVTQIINGNHHNRAVKAHQVTLQTLFDLRIEAFLEDHHGVHDFLQSCAKGLPNAGQRRMFTKHTRL